MGTKKDMKESNYKPKILFAGPIGFMSGYGEHARYIFNILLENQDKYDLYLAPTSWANASFNLQKLFSPDQIQLIHSLSQKTAAHVNDGKSTTTRKFDLALHVAVPNEWDIENLADKFIGITAGLETDMCSLEWMQQIFRTDEVWVVSNHAKKTFKKTLSASIKNQRKFYGHEGEMPDKAAGFAVRDKFLDQNVKVIGFPSKRYAEETRDSLDLNLSTKFNFLSINQMGPRKNVETLVADFLRTFKDNPDVGLVLKSHMQNHSVPDKFLCEKILKHWVQLAIGNDEYKCSLYLLHGNLDPAEMNSLYHHKDIHCYVSPTHGEGFGLPLYEAACAGMPIVTVPWSGHMDFLDLNDSKGYLFERIRYMIQPVGAKADRQYISPENNWAVAAPGATGKAMKNTYEAYKPKQRQAEKLQKIILNEKQFQIEDIGERIVQNIDNLVGGLKEEYSSRRTKDLLATLGS